MPAGFIQNLRPRSQYSFKGTVGGWVTLIPKPRSLHVNLWTYPILLQQHVPAETAAFPFVFGGLKHYPPTSASTLSHTRVFMFSLPIICMEMEIWRCKLPFSSHSRMTIWFSALCGKSGINDMSLHGSPPKLSERDSPYGNDSGPASKRLFGDLVDRKQKDRTTTITS